MAATKSRKPDPEESRTGGKSEAPNAVWFKPIMFGLMIVGFAWVIVFYLSQTQLPIPGIGAGNILIGFGIAFIGFLMTTRWR